MGQLPSSLPLARGEVHSWCAHLDVPPETSARLYATLTGDERGRSARFRFDRDRRRFIVARGVLRDLLARYLETGPERVRFVYNAFGKPALNPQSGSEVTFNLSHSGRLALIAIARAVNVGVDVEYIKWQPDCLEVARQLFPATEVEYLSGLPSHLQGEAFFSCWTQREAYVKASGAGLSMPLNGISPAEARIPGSRFQIPDCWSVYTLRPAPDYAGALAIEGSGWRLRQWQWNTRQH